GAAAVDEVPAVAGVRDHLAGSGIDLLRLYARPGRLQRRLDRALHDRVHLAVALGRAPDHGHAGDVARKAGLAGPDVDDDRISLSELALAALMVWERAVRARADDPEGRHRALRGEMILHHLRELGLGHARPNRCKRSLHRTIGDCRIHLQLGVFAR